MRLSAAKDYRPVSQPFFAPLPRAFEPTACHPSYFIHCFGGEFVAVYVDDAQVLGEPHQIPNAIYFPSCRAERGGVARLIR